MVDAESKVCACLTWARSHGGKDYADDSAFGMGVIAVLYGSSIAV